MNTGAHAHSVIVQRREEEGSVRGRNAQELQLQLVKVDLLLQIVDVLLLDVILTGILSRGMVLPINSPHP